MEDENIIQHIKPTSTVLKGIYQDFMKIFDCKSEQELLRSLEIKNVAIKQACAKTLKKGEGAWVCKDCEKDASCIICNECYEKSKEKHQNHTKLFKNKVAGCCDCGDPDSWKPEGFCTEHQGLITKDNEIIEYINRTFNENTLNKIHKNFKDLFFFLVNCIQSYEEKQESIYVELICDIINYIGLLATSNYALLHIIVPYLEMNFTIKTLHGCFKVDYFTKQIHKLEIKDVMHLCDCSLFQNIIRIWDAKFDSKLKIDKIFYIFLKSYKFKYLFGFSYISLYDTVMKNQSEHLKSFSVQIMTIEDIAECIVSSEDFVNSFFDKLYYLTNFYLDEEEDIAGKNYDTLFNVIFEFFMDINYLSKPKPVKILAKNVRVMKILIDILAIIQNRIKFESATTFKYEGFQENFVQIELYLLYLFSLLTTNFDFSITKNADEVLFYLMDKLRLKAYFPLKENEYSFHIPLNRALAMFLNRYSFYESSNQKIDIFMSIKNILYKYYNYIFTDNEGIDNNDNNGLNKKNKLAKYNFENMLLDQIRETLRFIGFINSIQCKYWVYYGENMLYYHILYWAYDQFYLCDFSLLKLILSQDYTSEIINIPVLMNLCDINSSYKNFMNSLFYEEKYIEGNHKNLFIKNLEIFLKLFRNHSYILDLLANSNERIRSSKLEDSLLVNLVNSEEINFRDFVKVRIVHIILSKGNSIYFSEILKMLPFFIKEYMKQSIIDEILIETCDTVVNKNKPVLFKLKNEYLSKTDIFYILDPKNEVHAEKYIIEFKLNEISLLNTPTIATFNFMKIINGNFANHFFNNEKNILLCIKVTNFFLTKISKNELSPNFRMIMDFMKFIDLFLNIYSNNGYLSKYEGKINHKSLVENLSKIKTSDNILLNCCKYLQEKIQNVFFYDLSVNISNTTMNSSAENDVRKQKLKEMKEKTAALFKTKSTSFKQNFGLEVENDLNNVSSNQSQLPTSITNNVSNSNIFKMNSVNLSTCSNNVPMLLLEDEDRNKIFDCVICRLKINSKEFLEKPFGRVGTFSSNSFIYHSKLQTIKKEYEKIIINSKFSNHHEGNNINTNGIREEGNHLFDNDQQLFIKELMLMYKRTKPELKKSLRFISCNHYIHFNCYLSYIVNYVINSADETKQFLFICPLCKTIANAFIPCFDYVNLMKNEEASKILRGLTFAELFVIYKDILSQNISLNGLDLNFYKYKNYENEFKTDENVIYAITHFIEKIVSLQIKSSFLINDFKNKNNQLRYYESIRNFFLTSLNLVDILSNDEYERVLDILKEYIISLRLLIKSNYLDPQVFFSRLFHIQFYWCTDFANEENISYNIDTDKVTQLFFENLFLILVLLDDTETNYFCIIFRHFLPLILLQYFILNIYKNSKFKLTLELFEKSFLIDNFMFLLVSPQESSSLKTFLNYFLRKAVLLKNIFTDCKRIDDNFIDVNDEFTYYCEQLGLNVPIAGGQHKIIELLEFNEDIYPSFWTFREDIREISKRLFGNYHVSKLKKFQMNIVLLEKNEPYFELINPSLLLITNHLNFHFVSIPNDLLDLSMKYYKLICPHCNNNPAYAILCLVCGEKICYTDSCCRNFGKKKNLYEYIWHNKICGSGDGIYLHLYNGEITMSLLDNFINTKMSIYLNKYGESLKGRSISDEYRLNDDVLSNMLKEYKNLSYRNYFKVGGQSFYNIEDEDDA